MRGVHQLALFWGRNRTSCVWLPLTWPPSPITTFLQQRPRWASERWSSSGSGRRAAGYAVTRIQVNAARVLFSEPSSQQDIKLSGSDPTWVRKKATYGLSTLCTSAGMMEGEVDLFSQRHPDKDGDWEATEIRILSLSLSFSLFIFQLLLSFFFFLLFFFMCFFSRAYLRQRNVRWIAVRLRGSGPVCQHSGRRFLLRWQVLQWMNDIQPRVANVTVFAVSHHLTCINSENEESSTDKIQSLCYHNSESTSNCGIVTPQLNIVTHSLPEGMCHFIRSLS